MVLDRNPKFGEDTQYQMNASRVADMLWSATKGQLRNIPSSYLENLDYEYSDGFISLLGLLDKVTFSGQPSYEEFVEVVKNLIYVDPNAWTFAESILEIQAEKLLSASHESEFDYSEMFDFAAPGDMSDKVELFLKKVIASVYRDGVSSVTDKEGNPPNAQNRYLLSEDGKSFEGIFYDKVDANNQKKFPFVIRENSEGNYEISY